MEHVTNTNRILLIVPGNTKKDLVKRFEQLVDEFKNEAVNGSIQLHFSQGYLAKLQNTRFD